MDVDNTPNLKDVSSLIMHTKESQLRFAYFFISLSVASLGFSINQTLNKDLSGIQIPLFLAILLFFISIVLGFSYIRILIASLNFDIQNIQKYNELEVSEDLSSDEKYKKQMENYANSKTVGKKFSDKNILNFKFQKLAFLSAIVFFIMWRIMEMSCFI